MTHLGHAEPLLPRGVHVDDGVERRQHDDLQRCRAGHPRLGEPETIGVQAIDAGVAGPRLDSRQALEHSADKSWVFEVMEANRSHFTRARRGECRPNSRTSYIPVL